ncbi:probable DNA double-strand break repair Rad50 ATPase [Plodia interpunctella]|uniref:probable DNA double-strand break repair Rad50 ATPase n=1 Tax=Plodia interpunctella TaxID=58824 RepID=UPI0023676873|nr:probable DNA double-strand break repair Rad50 ATPase [Plodia interpunctella]
MEETDISGLDTEFKRYLQIMRPYLGLLEDQDTIDICNAWIQRLSKCKKKEKYLRNKYVFSLCFQLAKGSFEDPFTRFPTCDSLPPIVDEVNSDSSSEVEYVVINADEESTKFIYGNNTVSESECYSQSLDFDHDRDRVRKREIHVPNQTVVYTCSSILKNKQNNEEIEDEYKNRTNNLIMKLREIKLENERLHNELEELKEEAKTRPESRGSDMIVRVDKTTSACEQVSASPSAVLSLKLKLQEAQNSRNVLIETIKHLQEKIDDINEVYKQELEEIKLSHEFEIKNCKLELKNELTEINEKRLEEQKESYENKLKELHEVIEMNKCGFEAQKSIITVEKDKIIDDKDSEISRLQKLLEEEKNNIHSLIKRLSDQSKESKETDNSSEVQKIKIDQLEKRLYKMEKSKSKCIRMYEAKLANLQREKHLAECSLQLQLVRQRAQIITEVTDENQAELTSTLDKLEAKYKEIVANVQSTAIQRRVQDQITLDSVVQATMKTENISNSRGTNRSQFSGRTLQNHSREDNGFDCDISSLLRGNKVGNIIVGNKSFGEESVTGYCLDGERMGQLFERMYIPQRDTNDAHLKK